MPNLSAMQTTPPPVGPLASLIDQVNTVESWFAEAFSKSALAFATSVDIRNAGYKISAIDTNLFPAGFNNLPQESKVLSIEAIQKTLTHLAPDSQHILLIIESNIGNPMYLEHVAALAELIESSGYTLTLGSLQSFSKAKHLSTHTDSLTIMSVTESMLADDQLIILNNDLSQGVPPLFNQPHGPIEPPVTLGWHQRHKSDHFQYYEQEANSFAQTINMDPWLLTPLFTSCVGIDFMEKTGFEQLQDLAQDLLNRIHQQYARYHITDKPFIILKADQGTFGQAVLPIFDGNDIAKLNRKQRQNMASLKGNRPVHDFILQEGIYTKETYGQQHASAESVIYFIGHQIVGGFLRVHPKQSAHDNLNRRGMFFEPLTLTQNPSYYLHSIVARIALLAALKEREEG